MLKTIKTYSVTVYVPSKSIDAYIDAIQNHIPSFDSAYDRVVWWSYVNMEEGTEQFRPLEGASPTKGEIGETIRAPSIRLELCFPYDRALLEDFIKHTLIPHHPWEKPVISIKESEIINIM